MRPQPLFCLRIALGLCVVVGLCAAARAEKGNAAVTIEKVEYQGWKNNLKLSNGETELIVTLDVGPRVISYRLLDGKNVFKNYEEMIGKSGESVWMIRGGHRLWTSPEDPARTYAPDNGPVAFTELGPGQARCTPRPESAFGIQKEIDVRLDPTGSKTTLVHRVTNVGKGPTVLAVWSLSVMAPGGTEIIPLPPKRPHPGSAQNAKSPADFAPNLTVSVWPFLDFQDPRWRFGSKFITLTQDSHRGATKIGLSHRSGGVGYLNGGTLFVKRFEYREGQTYPDGGVNYETYTDQNMLEMESLGPLVKLAPGQSVEHLETWELFRGVGEAKEEAKIEEKVAAKLR